MFHQLSNVEKRSLFWHCFDLSLSWYNEEKGYYSAIRRYHYYKKYWQPIKDQTLAFQVSCNKIYVTKFRKNCGTLTKSSQATKFLLGRWARIIEKLAAFNYCVLPLVQGG